MVVVLAAAARAVDVLPACGAERVCVTVLCQRLQGPEDGGEPGAVTGRPQPDVQVLGVMKVPAAARACLIVARRAVMRTQRDFCRGAPVWGVPAGGLGCQQPVSRGPWLTTWLLPHVSYLPSHYRAAARPPRQPRCDTAQEFAGMA